MISHFLMKYTMHRMLLPAIAGSVLGGEPQLGISAAVSVQPEAATFPLGSPMIVTMAIRNCGRQPITLLRGSTEPNGLRFDVAEGTGAAVKQPRWRFSRQLLRLLLQPKSTYTARACLNRYITFRQPGLLRIKYWALTMFFPDDRSEPGTLKKLATEGVLTIELLPADDDELRRRLGSLAAQLSTPDRQRQREAAQALCSVDHPLALEFLPHVLETDSRYCKWLAIESLRCLGTREAQDMLIERGVVPNETPEIVGAALEALRANQRPVGDEKIKALLASGKSGIIFRTIRYLSKAGDSSHIPLLEPFTAHRDRFVAKAAKECLARLKQK